MMDTKSNNVYAVQNDTSDYTIYWRDQAWPSPEVAPHENKRIKSDHDATVTMYARKLGTDEEENWGHVLIPLGRTLYVTGDRKWHLD